MISLVLVTLKLSRTRLLDIVDARQEDHVTLSACVHLTLWPEHKQKCLPEELTQTLAAAATSPQAAAVTEATAAPSPIVTLVPTKLQNLPVLLSATINLFTCLRHREKTNVYLRHIHSASFIGMVDKSAA